MVSLDTPTNWSKACTIWIQEIQVAFDDPGAPVSIGRGGFLRAIRRVTALLAVGVSLSFTLHCTRPPAVTHRTTGGSNRGTGMLGGRVFEEEGLASWYGGNGDGFEGRPTANGEIFDPEALTAAHKTLPLGSIIEVENLDNGKKVLVRVNDRGPFVRGRVLDLSKKGARQLGFLGQGTANVRLRTVDGLGNPAPVDEALERGNPYVVQIAALSDIRNVEALKKELEPSYGPLSIQDAVLRDGREVKRVRVGSYSNRDEAEKAANELAKRLKDRGVDPFITRRR